MPAKPLCREAPAQEKGFNVFFFFKRLSNSLNFEDLLGFSRQRFGEARMQSRSKLELVKNDASSPFTDTRFQEDLAGRNIRIRKMLQRAPFLIKPLIFYKRGFCD